MNRNSKSEWMWMMAAGLAVVPMTMSGCSKPPPPPPADVPTYVPPPPPPPQADVVALLQEMNADKRVQFPEEMAPIDVGYARAIIQFASSFAQGDEEALSGMLGQGANGTLNEMVESGVWYDETDVIEAVRVVYLTEPVEDEFEDERPQAEDQSEEMPTAETVRDELLQTIADGSFNADLVLSGISQGGIQTPFGFKDNMANASSDEIQPIVDMLGMDFINRLDEKSKAMSDIQAEFEQGNMTPEQLVTAMYDQGIFALQVEFEVAFVKTMMSGFERMGVDSVGFSGGEYTANSGGADLRLAIQKPGAAFALSFSAHKQGDGYIFLPTAELGDIRARASDFTGKSAGLGSFGDQLGGLDFGNDFGNPDGASDDGNSTQGGGGPSPTRPDVPTGPGPSSPGG